MRNKTGRRIRPAQLESEELLPMVVLTHDLSEHMVKKELAPYFRLKVASTPNQLKAALKTADGLITLHTISITKEILEGAPYLKVIGNVAVDFKNIDLTACSEKGIQVVNAPDKAATPTNESMARQTCFQVATILRGRDD